MRDVDAYRAYMRQYMSERREKRRQKLRDMLGGACAFCGSTEGLEFDHIDREAKSFTVSTPRALDGPWERLVAEVGKCRLLCKPCHIERTREQLSRITHGTYWCYTKYKCRCTECHEAFTVKNRQYKQNSISRSSTGRAASR
jgi:hypothetical protein